MELYAFTRFHVKAGNEMPFEEAVREVLVGSLGEVGLFGDSCVPVQARSATVLPSFRV